MGTSCRAEVAAPGTPQRALEEAAQAYLDRARVLGIPAEEAVEVVRSKASGG